MAVSFRLLLAKAFILLVLFYHRLRASIKSCIRINTHHVLQLTIMYKVVIALLVITLCVSLGITLFYNHYESKLYQLLTLSVTMMCARE